MDWINRTYFSYFLSFFAFLALAACGGGGGGKSGGGSKPAPFDQTSNYANFESDRSDIQEEGLSLRDDQRSMQAVIERMNDHQLSRLEGELKKYVTAGKVLEDHGRDDNDFDTELDSGRTALKIVEEVKHRRSSHGAGGLVLAPTGPSADHQVYDAPKVECNDGQPPAETDNREKILYNHTSNLENLCQEECRKQGSTDGKYELARENGKLFCNCPRHVECIQKSSN